MDEKISDKLPEISNKSVVKPPKNSSKKWKRGFFTLLIILGLITLVALSMLGGWWLSEKNSTSVINSADYDGNTKITNDEASIAAVAEKVAPSVVSIVTSTSTASFFGTSNAEGAGTGIIISQNGYVMTNNHVVESANSISVIDSEGNTYSKVEFIGRDPLNDIAFLKIESDKSFTPATIGDSSTVRIGQQVVAIGNALGRYQNTVTSGIISGTGRPIVASDGRGSAESLTDLLQTDTSINSGNSGGPLLNMSGQVIGINTAVASDANGIGFAIPVNATKGVLSEVLASGEVSRAYIGINYIDLTPATAKQYNLSLTQGAYIVNQQGDAVVKNSPAEKAGLKDSDIIQKVNDKTVGTNGGFASLIGQYRVGDKVELTIVRGQETLTKEVTLGKYSS